jgi:hypothetical protein
MPSYFDRTSACRGRLSIFAAWLPSTPEPEPTNGSSIVAALRQQLRAQKQRYQTEIADLKAENERLQQALATARG